jgi:hypothetical protein
MQGPPGTPPRLPQEAVTRQGKTVSNEKEYCPESRPAGAPLTTLAGKLRPLGSCPVIKRSKAVVVEAIHDALAPCFAEFRGPSS